MGKQQGLTVHYELECSALFVLDHDSHRRCCLWNEVTPTESVPPSPQAFVTFSSLYKWRIWFHGPPQRGRWFLTLASQFGLRVQVAGLPESATFNDSHTDSYPESATGEGVRWLGSPFWPPPPHQGILLFCLILLSYMSSGVFLSCKLSLLKHHIFLILTQPSWDGYLLLYRPKSSILGTLLKPFF